MRSIQIQLRSLIIPQWTFLEEAIRALKKDKLSMKSVRKKNRKEGDKT